MITCVFTWYSHPLTHTVGRTCVPHVLRWGGVVWARRGIWSGACVPASISHSEYSTAVFTTSSVLQSTFKLIFNQKSKLTWKRDSSSPGDYWTLILSDPPGQRYWCHSFVCWWEDQKWRYLLLFPWALYMEISFTYFIKLWSRIQHIETPNIGGSFFIIIIDYYTWFSLCNTSNIINLWFY